MGLYEPVYKAGVIGLGFGRRDLQVALARVEVVGQQDIANAFAQVFLVFFGGGVGFGRFQVSTWSSRWQGRSSKHQRTTPASAGFWYMSSTSSTLATYSPVRVPIHHLSFSQGLSLLFWLSDNFNGRTGEAANSRSSLLEEQLFEKRIFPKNSLLH